MGAEDHASSSTAGADALTLVISLMAIILMQVLLSRPCSLKLSGTFKLPIPYWTAPVAGVLLLLACGRLSWTDVWSSVTGGDQLQPYRILILLMALAYISLSLDITGCFAFSAMHTTYASQGSSTQLLLCYYALSASLSAVTSTNVSLMAVTPVICYFSAATRTDPTPYLVAQFSAASTWGMLTSVSSPTNMIVAQAYGMGLGRSVVWMLLPTIAASASSVALLYLTHRASQPTPMTLPWLDPLMFLSDQIGAMFGVANMIGCLFLLTLAPALGWSLWHVALFCAILQAAYNFVVMTAARHWNVRTSYDGRQQLQLELEKQGLACHSSDEDVANSILNQEDPSNTATGQISTAQETSIAFRSGGCSPGGCSPDGCSVGGSIWNLDAGLGWNLNGANTMSERGSKPEGLSSDRSEYRRGPERNSSLTPSRKSVEGDWSVFQSRRCSETFAASVAAAADMYAEGAAAWLVRRSFTDMVGGDAAWHLMQMQGAGLVLPSMLVQEQQEPDALQQQQLQQQPTFQSEEAVTAQVSRGASQGKQSISPSRSQLTGPLCTPIEVAATKDRALGDSVAVSSKMECDAWYDDDCVGAASAANIASEFATQRTANQLQHSCQAVGDPYHSSGLVDTKSLITPSSLMVTDSEPVLWNIGYCYEQEERPQGVAAAKHPFNTSSEQEQDRPDCSPHSGTQHPSCPRSSAWDPSTSSVPLGIIPAGACSNSQSSSCSGNQTGSHPGPHLSPRSNSSSRHPLHRSTSRHNHPSPKQQQQQQHLHQSVSQKERSSAAVIAASALLLPLTSSHVTSPGGLSHADSLSCSGKGSPSLPAAWPQLRGLSSKCETREGNTHSRSASGDAARSDTSDISEQPSGLEHGDDSPSHPKSCHERRRTLAHTRHRTHDPLEQDSNLQVSLSRHSVVCKDADLIGKASQLELCKQTSAGDGGDVGVSSSPNSGQEGRLLTPSQPHHAATPSDTSSGSSPDERCGFLMAYHSRSSSFDHKLPTNHASLCTLSIENTSHASPSQEPLQSHAALSPPGPSPLPAEKFSRPLHSLSLLQLPIFSPSRAPSVSDSQPSPAWPGSWVSSCLYHAAPTVSEITARITPAPSISASQAADANQKLQVAIQGQTCMQTAPAALANVGREVSSFAGAGTKDGLSVSLQAGLMQLSGSSQQQQHQRQQQQQQTSWPSSSSSTAALATSAASSSPSILNNNSSLGIHSRAGWSLQPHGMLHSMASITHHAANILLWSFSSVVGLVQTGGQRPSGWPNYRASPEERQLLSVGPASHELSPPRAGVPVQQAASLHDLTNFDQRHHHHQQQHHHQPNASTDHLTAPHRSLDIRTARSLEIRNSSNRPSAAQQWQQQHQPHALSCSGVTPYTRNPHTADTETAVGADLLKNPRQDPEEAAWMSQHAAMTHLQPRTARLIDTLTVLPWGIVPFLLSMFMLAEALSAQGWVGKIAAWLGNVCQHSVGLSLASSVGISIMLSNVMTTQPAVVLLTRVLLHPEFEKAVTSSRSRGAALLAVLIGCNMGSGFTSAGSVAGVQWVKFLREMGVEIGYARFARLMLPSAVVTTVIASLTMWAQLAVVGE